jgi:MCP family monocarboxylic acid transporter-like MFS transporter 13/MCP family monocarboxylic acid transporter-like MFS transporter 12
MVMFVNFKITYFDTGVITGPLLITCGWRNVTVLGTVISAAGLMLSYLAPNIYVLFVTYGVMTGKNLIYMCSSSHMA